MRSRSWGGGCGKETAHRPWQWSPAPSSGLSAGSLREPPRRISCDGPPPHTGEVPSTGSVPSERTAPEMRRGAGAQRPCAQPRSATPRALPRVPVRAANRNPRLPVWGRPAGERHGPLSDGRAAGGPAGSLPFPTGQTLRQVQISSLARRTGTFSRGCQRGTNLVQCLHPRLFLCRLAETRSVRAHARQSDSDGAHHQP